MTIAIPLVPPARPRRRARTAHAGRIATGIGVFAAIVAGWLGFKQWQVDSAPLPGVEGRQGECAIWFVGSSTMFRWATLDQDMAPWIAHNRGIGGARLDYVVRRFGNEHGAIPPSAIVFYGGENDIAAGDDVATTTRHFESFLARKTEEYGALPVIAVSLKPSPKRWDDRAEQRGFNQALQRIALLRQDVSYVDIVPNMLVGGRPGPFYQADGVHMNVRGYAMWTPILRAALRSALPRAVVDRCTDPRGGAGE